MKMLVPGAGGHSRDPSGASTLIGSVGAYSGKEEAYAGKRDAVGVSIIEHEEAEEMDDVPPGNIRVRTDITLSWRERERLDYQHRVF